ARPPRATSFGAWSRSFQTMGQIRVNSVIRITFVFPVDWSSFQWLAGRRWVRWLGGLGSGGKKLHGLPLFRRRRLPRPDRLQGRPLALRRLRPPAAALPRRRPSPRQVLSDRARQPGAAPAVAPDRAAAITRRTPPDAPPRGADPRP